MLPRAGLYFRTIRHLHLAQILWRLRLRATRQFARLFPRFCSRAWKWSCPYREHGWDVNFLPLDAHRFNSQDEATRIKNGTVNLLNTHVSLSDIAEFRNLSQLRRFHYFYLDWLWHLINFRGESTTDSQITNMAMNALAVGDFGFGSGDKWSPYVVSLRLWTLCGLHSKVQDAEAKDDIRDLILSDAGFLERNMEFDVCGNHLVKNLKALIGASVFVRDFTRAKQMLNLLSKQVCRQVLNDGGHFELSASYHGQVLGDLIDIENLVKAFAPLEEDSHFLSAKIADMRRWLSTFRRPDGSVPSFNDGGTVSARELELLGVPETDFHARISVLEDSGYAVIRPRTDVVVCFDFGQPCPPELPAHSQADCLSITLSVGNWNALVDTGTSEYGNGDRRQFERSTAAHSTVEIDGENQTEVWGAFRAGRRARAKLLSFSTTDRDILISAEHDGYRFLKGRPRHRRTLEVTESSIHIHDEVLGRGKHRIASRLHVNDDRKSTRGQFTGSAVFTNNGHEAEIESSSDTQSTHDMLWSESFGRLNHGTGLIQEFETELPCRSSWVINWN